jgi:RHS repeat-associated protein
MTRHTGVNTLRAESYTSFNMPAQITFSNLIANNTVCPPDYSYTASTGLCVKPTTFSVAATVNYNCPAGQTHSGSSCVATSSATPHYACGSGTLSGANCLTASTSAATSAYVCPVGTSYVGSVANMNTGALVPACALGGMGILTTCPDPYGGMTLVGTSGANNRGVIGSCYYRAPVVNTCPAGWTLSGSTCSKVTTTSASIASYSCPSGATLSGSSCVATSAATISYSCQAGQTLSGSTCSQTVSLTAAPTSSNASDRTLNFVYGPEHQRIKQNIALTGNGTSSYFAGNVWYLNGEDSLDLMYEKEVRTNGTTENKHYISADGVVFGEFISRTGTLNGLPATSTNYFHHDQLGSIAAITNEVGAVVERLAYDTWGKRRFIGTTPGLPDTLDTLVGKSTDRGYTMHEHLDEVGIIHMNGRIYDPLIGRFMSADPNVTNPYDLQSFNRYAYVLNNPLRYTDPTGYNEDGPGGHGSEAGGYGGCGGDCGRSGGSGSGGKSFTPADGGIGILQSDGTFAFATVVVVGHRNPSSFGGGGGGGNSWSSLRNYYFQMGVGFTMVNSNAKDSPLVFTSIYPGNPSDGFGFAASVIFSPITGQFGLQFDRTEYRGPGLFVGISGIVGLTIARDQLTAGKTTSVSSGREGGIGLGESVQQSANTSESPDQRSASVTKGLTSVGSGVGAYSTDTATSSVNFTTPSLSAVNSLTTAVSTAATKISNSIKSWFSRN